MTTTEEQRGLADAREAMRERYIADMEANLAQALIDRSMFDHVLLGQGWIVECAQLALTFTVTNRIVDDPRPCGGPMRAMRFTQADARAVAESVKNGAGDKGYAIHIKDAMDNHIARIREAIQALKEIRK